MDLWRILFDGLLAGFFATALGVVLTAPTGYAVPVFFCGFSGRFVRDLLTSLGLSLNWSTLVAAAVVVLVGTALIRRHAVSPVALVSGVLPLAASASMFDAILALMRVSSAKGEALQLASASLISSSAKVFNVSLAIAIGLAAGLAIVRAIRGERIWDSV
jgi:uncharacterized membrane protein YjjB (DUF3815 family)